MLKEWKDKWVAALRSGKYKQATHKLREGESNSFCCLGVLCDITKETLPGSYWHDGRFAADRDAYGSVNFVPREVRDTAGMHSTEGSLGEHIKIDKPNAKFADNLAAVNDAGMSFDEIADLIEKYWETL